MPDVATPDAGFDREWAVALVNRAVERLGAEHADEPRLQFECSNRGSSATLAPSRREGAAERLGVPNAVRVAVHRLRRRFRELVKQESSKP
jgi:RNA polymerase sigma-70 factor (ECF subfamily)